MEHHSNIVPWQLLCERTGATLRWFGITDEGRLDESNWTSSSTSARRSCRSCTDSNILGTVERDRRITTRAARSARCACSTRRSRCRTCRWTSSDYDVDFLAFTGHKMCGPTGIGVLWGRASCSRDAAVPRRRLDDRDGDDERLDVRAAAGPVRGGHAADRRGGRAGRGRGLPVGVGMEAIPGTRRSSPRTRSTPCRRAGLRIFGPRVPVGGAARSRSTWPACTRTTWARCSTRGHPGAGGHHCARPTCVRFGVPAMTRMSLYLYNTTDEIDALVRGLDKVRKVFA
jgi:cysteine desulfurase/selenocysteine lyase